jgi:transcriptional regulator with XRE-family HTH domain
MSELLNAVDVHVGARVRMTRQFRDLDLATLSRAIEIAESHLAQLESGQRRFEAAVLAKIARALNVRSSFFFEGLSSQEFGAQTRGATLRIAPFDAANDNSERRRLQIVTPTAPA